MHSSPVHGRAHAGHTLAGRAPAGRITAALTALALATGTTVALSTAAHAQDAGFYDSARGPQFYGAQKVTLAPGAGFDPKDVRYRVFAQDFEDGNLTQKITLTGNNVNTAVPGTYEVNYTVTDADGNQENFTTQVIVEAQAQDTTVVAKVRNNFSMANMHDIGVRRGDNQDRQALGVLLQPGQTLQAKVLTGPDLRISVPSLKGSTDGATVGIGKNGYATVSAGTATGVPFVYTPMNGREAPAVWQDITMELKYPAGLQKLPYYFRGDSEQEFFNEWRTSQAEYAVVDGEAATALAPLSDIDLLVNHYPTGHKSLEDFYVYTEKTLAEYNRALGLSKQAENPLHQLVNTRYFMRPNADGNGSGYYGTDHIGLSAPTVAWYFDQSWLGLHEIGHGFQGGLAYSKNMDLGEVSNNILGYFVQHNHDITTANVDYWLKPEEQQNYLFPVRDRAFGDYNLRDELYILTNMLETFDDPLGAWSDIYQYYREQKAAGVTLPNDQAFILGLAEKRGVNVLPYLEQFGLPQPAELKERLASMNLDTIVPMGQVITDTSTREHLLADASRNLYTPVLTSQLAQYTGSLTVHVHDAAALAKLDGKTVRLVNGGRVVAEKPVGETVQFDQVPVGQYQLLMPLIDSEYIYPTQWIQVVQNQTTETTYTYDSRSNYGDSFTVANQWGGVGATGRLNGDGTKLTLTFAKDPMWSDAYGGADKAQEIFSAIRVLRGDQALNAWELLPKQNYLAANGGTKTAVIDLQPGDIVEITSKQRDTVAFFDATSGTQISINNMRGRVTTAQYTVAGSHFLPAGWTEEDYLEYGLYPGTLATKQALLQEGKDSLTGESLSNPTIRPDYKAQLIEIYESLKPEDRTEFDAFIEALRTATEPAPTSTSASSEPSAATPTTAPASSEPSFSPVTAPVIISKADEPKIPPRPTDSPTYNPPAPSPTLEPEPTESSTPVATPSSTPIATERPTSMVPAEPTSTSQLTSTVPAEPTSSAQPSTPVQPSTSVNASSTSTNPTSTPGSTASAVKPSASSGSSKSWWWALILLLIPAALSLVPFIEGNLGGKVPFLAPWSRR